MADDFFSNMIGNSAQEQFDSEITANLAQADDLLSRQGVPVGELTDESLASFEKLCEGRTAQLGLRQKLLTAYKGYAKTLVKIQKSENDLREAGQLTQQKLNELRGEALQAWANYQSATAILTTTTRNAVNAIGHATGEEVTYQNKIHQFALEKKSAQYEGRYQKAEAKHQTWMTKLREGISNAIAGINQQSPQIQGQQQKVFGIFEGGRRNRA